MNNQEALEAFEPCASIQEETPKARASGKALIEEGKAAGLTRGTFVFVSNRLEGNAI